MRKINNIETFVLKDSNNEIKDDNNKNSPKPENKKN